MILRYSAAEIIPVVLVALLMVSLLLLVEPDDTEVLELSIKYEGILIIE